MARSLVPLTVPLAVALVAATLACEAHDPPAPDASPFIAIPEVPVPFRPGSGEAGDLASRFRPGSGEAGDLPSRLPLPGAVDAAVDPSLLPQTHDKPSASDAAFQARVAVLWDAIATGDADRAMPAFFPLGAYKQVKDVADPAGDWKRRLVAAFVRDIRALHARLGADGASPAPAGAPSNIKDTKFAGLDVPESRARWVNPDEEYNKIGYYRVFGSKLRYEVGGQERAFDVKSLISWRGEWYVVHLSAIK